MGFEEVLQAAAATSCSASALVLITLLVFESMRQKLFMRIISMISVADLLGNISYLFSKRPREGTVWCELQGFCNSYFYPVSWVWTTILMYYLFALASTGKLPFSEPVAHLLGWGVPLLFALLVLTTNRYEMFSDNDDEEVCTIGPDNTSAFVWHITLYYGFFLVCTLTMVLLYTRARLLQRAGRTAVSARMVALATSSLQLYPLGMAISWLPEIVGFIIRYNSGDDGAYRIAMVFRILNGALTAGTFFWKSREARHSWLGLCGVPLPLPPRNSGSSAGGLSASEFDEEAPARRTLVEHSFLGFEEPPPARTASSASTRMSLHREPSRLLSTGSPFPPAAPAAP